MHPGVTRGAEPPSSPRPKRLAAERPRSPRGAWGNLGGGAPRKHTQVAPPENHTGVVLILVLVILMLVVAAALSLAREVSVEVTVARQRADAVHLRAMTASALERAMAEVRRDDTPEDTLFDAWRDDEAGFAGFAFGEGDGAGRVWLLLPSSDPGDGRELRHGICDEASKLDVNTATRDQLLALPGITEEAVDGILDWRDEDDELRELGAESPYYNSLEPGYEAKNGPIDDLSELLMIHGITSEMYWGPAGGQDGYGSRLHRSFESLDTTGTLPYAVGMADLFTCVSSGLININTADMTALQLIPLVDENLARAIIRERSGLDEMEGTEDDLPYQSVAELARAEGMYPELLSQMTRYCTTKSLAFEVRVDVQIGTHRREYVAVLYRGSPQEIPMLSFNWQ